MQVKSIAECPKGSILQYFQPALSYHMALRPLFCPFLSGRLRQVSLYVYFNETTYRAGLQSTTPPQLQCYTRRRRSNFIPIPNWCIHDSSSFPFHSIGQYCAGGGGGLSIMLSLIHFFHFYLDICYILQVEIY